MALLAMAGARCADTHAVMTLKWESMDSNNQSAVPASRFLTGLVFGFDIGTGSIGYAVRQGANFKDVGVLICESEGSDLSNRRNLRRQRRTLRSRKARRKWFATELIKLGLHKPEVPQEREQFRLNAQAEVSQQEPREQHAGHAQARPAEAH